MLSERERFRRLVRPHIGNRAGRIDSEVVYAGPNIAGIAYTFSGIHQGRKDGSRTSLQPLSTFLDRALDPSNASFTDIAPVFDELLYDLLQTLHRSAPAGPRTSWMEPLFGETASLRDSHEMRLPPLIDVELSSFSDPSPDVKSIRLSERAGDEIYLPMCRVQRTAEGGFTVVFRNPENGRAHRANLTGDIAQFISQFRSLRPNRALSIHGKVLRPRAVFYDRVRTELVRDAEWLEEHGFNASFENIDEVLCVFDAINRETLGIIHGDLNLNNILLDVDGGGRPVRGALWLIDFARTRRDSLAHDFVELEADLVTRILAPASGAMPTSAIMDFQHSLDAGPLYAPRHFDAATLFVSEACQFIRRAATSAGIEKREYLASLVMYYLLALKLQQRGDTAERHAGPAMQIGRWAFVGASAAYSALLAELEMRIETGTDKRISVKKTDPGRISTGRGTQPGSVRIT
jgi:hypothetical protein